MADHTPGPWAYDPTTKCLLAGDEGAWDVVATVSNDTDGKLLSITPELLEIVNVVWRGSQTWYVPGDVVDRIQRALSLLEADQ